MNAPLAPPIITTEQLLVMSEDGMERWLIEGQLREKPMTRRNRFHSGAESKIVRLLLNWLDGQPEPRGDIFSGEAGCRLRRNPDTSVGIDVVYISAEVLAAQPADTTLIEGVPTLVVEILSPSDKQEEIEEKVASYLAAGVPLVWIVSPRFRTVTVHRPDAEPELFNATQELSGGPHLPGFRVAVARIFGRT